MILRVVRRADPSTVVWDLDDATGAANPRGCRSRLRALDLGRPERPLDLVRQRGDARAAAVLADPQVRTLQAVVDVSAATVRDLEAGVSELYRVLDAETAPDHLIAWDDGSGARYLEPLGIESPAPALRRDSEQTLVATQARDISLTLDITCQPYLLDATTIDSDRNLLRNATLCHESTTNPGRPADWTQTVTSNLSGEQIDPDASAARFGVVTTATYSLEQTTGVGTVAPGDVVTLSFYARAEPGGIRAARAVVLWRDSSGAQVGSDQAGSPVTLDATWRRVTVTTAPAPANTSRATASLRIENASGTPVTIWLRDAQLEKATSASTFRTGTETVSNDPSSPYGRVCHLVIEGDAPAPVELDIAAGTGSKIVGLLLAERWDRGRIGANKLTDYLTRTRWIGATSAGGWTVSLGSGAAVVSDGTAVGGQAVEVTVSAGSIGVEQRRLRAVRTDRLDSLRGDWLVLARCRALEGGVPWRLRLAWATANVDPAPGSAEDLTYELGTRPFATGWDDVPLGVLRVPEAATLGAIVVEVHAARLGGVATDARLRISDLFLVPWSPRSRLRVPGSGSRVARGSLLSTAAAIVGDPAWTFGERLGDAVRLDASGQAVGVAPSSGIVLSTGRQRVTCRIARADPPRTGMRARVVNVTDGVEVVSRSITGVGDHIMEFDATSGKAYQPQVVHQGGNGLVLIVASIEMEHVPTLAAGERMLTDPGRVTAERLDASGSTTSPLDLEGQVPFVLAPGRHVLVVVPAEPPLAGHALDDAPVGRTVTVRHRYTPRWHQ